MKHKVEGAGTGRDMGRETVTAVHAQVLQALGPDMARDLLFGMLEGAGAMLGRSNQAVTFQASGSAAQVGRDVVNNAAAHMGRQAANEHDATMFIVGMLAASTQRLAEHVPVEDVQRSLREMADQLPQIRAR
jgi:hypothetical protein